MKALIQRVSAASVTVAGETVGEIEHGLLIFLGLDKSDTQMIAQKLLSKILRYRVFNDAAGHMNLDVAKVSGSLLIVSQFTLAADTQKGLRPSFSSAMPPKEAEALYDFFVAEAALVQSVATGRFGADMQVSLVNDGPVTFLLSAD
ncbi:MAG: D-tyrosyl-tRNA(Tyr) deacylase [Gammaproteobacteria bacterium]|nr:D-tyrosyl-tRNA(Tyr) deacylase [Gammaproteobacteria bacterium]MBT5054437.1 D-tyrosyl-tRNA(Tyr) deacylase [Gammaproteobacteria bacterium]